MMSLTHHLIFPSSNHACSVTLLHYLSQSDLRLGFPMQEPAPALLRGPLSPTSIEPGAPGSRVLLSHSDGMRAAEAEELGSRVYTSQGEAERQGQPGGQRGRGWRSALERTSVQLRDNLLSVPEGVLPMGDATGQVTQDWLNPHPERYCATQAHALRVLTTKQD